MKYIANCSFGKDSTAMVLKLIELKYPLDIVVFYNTGVEFEAVYKTRDKLIPILKEHNIEFVELQPKMPFMEKMLTYKYKSRKGEDKVGYGWCGGACRWHTRDKISTIDKYLKQHRPYIQYLGIAYDERERLDRPENQMTYKRFPLVDLQMTEQQCLDYCYSKGFDFDGLYKYLTRMSCWCCRNKNLKELKAYKEHFPEYFNKLVELEKLIGKPIKPPKYLLERFNNENKEKN